MIARKILMTHMGDEASIHRIDETIETLASKLYFHGHPINRKEAKDELGLKIGSHPAPALETAMWKLYVEYEKLMKNDLTFDPIGELWRTTGIVEGENGQIPVVPTGHCVTLDDTLALIESERLTCTFDVSRRFVVVGQGEQSEPLVRVEVLSQGWDHQRDQTETPTVVQ
jgi:hypothetical protein